MTFAVPPVRRQRFAADQSMHTTKACSGPDSRGRAKAEGVALKYGSQPCAG